MSDYIQESPRNTPIASRSDVIVIGGGPAGFSAAICAARQGAKTILIEQAGMVGGVATSGLMSHWTGSTRGGFYEEILDRTNDNPNMRMTINPEKLRTIMLEMLDEAGVELHLYTFASTPIMDGNRITGVITESKTGRQAFIGKVIIDASGDGDIAAKANVPFTKGRPIDNKMQPMTLMFKVAGVNTTQFSFPGGFEDSTNVPVGNLQQIARQEIPHPAGHVLLYNSTLPGVVTINMTNCINVDGTLAEDLTKADLTCRRQMEYIVAFLRKNAPGFENCYVISSASQIGVRETRHFHGEYTLNEDDINEAKLFDDWVVTKAHFNFDIHNIDGAGLDKDGAQHHFRQKNGYSIPYRCLLPLQVEGLLLAGRNISGTHKAHSNFRVMPICANIGQAAGIAAAICVKNDIYPRQLDVKELQAVLMLNGVTP
jgi:hypothetical protein